ncbi:MAG: patatin-like phospholipase family protein [Deltaproteobacteria bacterium]|nr:patatin-like phospholipase family protein [Deltaproteobacteria bacterium]
MKSVTDILYLYSTERLQELSKELASVQAQDTRGPKGDSCKVVQAGNTTLRFLLIDDIDRALEFLSDHYFNFVVVDARLCAHCERGPDCTPLSMQFMERIHYSADPDKRYPLSRIIAVLPDDDALAQHSFDLGKLRIGGFVVNPFSGKLFELMDQLYDPEPGKTAICLSGGGLEGFLFEAGVMLALNAHLQARSVTDFDIFCGISAGSFLGSFLANGTEPERIIEQLFEDKKAGSALTPQVIYDLDVREYASRFLSLGRSLAVLSGSEMFSNLLRAVPVGFFRGDALHDYIERLLNEEGRTNDFRKLQRELYIGATDQDRSTHVVFGAGQWRDVPISHAVRASAALTPFFQPVRVEGRYFVDGQYTRTSNFHIALERGAKLVVVVNPLVPIKVEETGYVRKKGGVFAALQALKAVVHTRFLHAFQASVDAYPDVDFVLFEPEGDLLRLMGGSPMKYNLRTEILNVAYRSTVQRIQRDYEVLQGTFGRHNLRLQRHPRLRGSHRAVF